MMYYQEDRASARTFVGLGVVVVVHIVVFIALKNGLASNVMPALPKSFQTVFIELSSPKPAKPAPAEPKIETPVMEDIQIPIPEIELPAESVMEMPVMETPAQQSDSGSGESTAITQLRVDPRFGLTRPDYPSMSRRLGEHGTVRLLLYVLPNGRVGEAKVERSSGYPRLDEAALREAKRNWRFIPATQGGQATAGWGTFAITFRLTD